MKYSKRTKLVCLLALFSIFNSESQKNYIPKKNIRPCCVKRPTYRESRPATIFIHGTLFPFVDLAIRLFDLSLGLTPALEATKFIHGRIPHILYAADPKQFPIESFYLFGWSGRLSFYARKKAARELYHDLRHFTGPLTIIGHSHGGNVALYLPEVAKENNDTNFKVDRLILLACPVMTLTEEYVKSPVFKKVISLYSTGDSTQIKDPQRLYKETRELSPECVKVPVFSGRLFPSAPNVIQRRVLLNKRNALHLEFLYKRFMRKLPAALNLLDDSVSHGLINDAHTEYILNIQRKDDDTPPTLFVKHYG